MVCFYRKYVRVRIIPERDRFLATSSTFRGQGIDSRRMLCFRTNTMTMLATAACCRNRSRSYTRCRLRDSDTALSGKASALHCTGTYEYAHRIQILMQGVPKVLKAGSTMKPYGLFGVLLIHVPHGVLIPGPGPMSPGTYTTRPIPSIST